VTELIEAIEAVAWQATLVTERLNATGRDYVAPDTAQSLTELARLTDTIAESIADEAIEVGGAAPASVDRVRFVVLTRTDDLRQIHLSSRRGRLTNNERLSVRDNIYQAGGRSN